MRKLFRFMKMVYFKLKSVLGPVNSGILILKVSETISKRISSGRQGFNFEAH